MTSICSNYQQHFQLTNGNIMLLHQQQQQLQQQLLQQHQHHQQQQQQQQLIAPKQPLGNSQLQNMQQTTGAASRSGSGVGPMLAKKKYTNSSSNFASLPYGGTEQQMPSVARRNARERNRVKQVNNGFVNLRQHLPQTVINSLSNGGRGASKKLSKVDTLRIAVEYIRGLQDMLDDDGQPRAQLIFSSTDECSNDSYNDDYNDSLDSPPRTQSHTAAYHHNHHSYHSASPTHSYSDASELSASYVKQELPEQEKQQQKQHAEQQQQFKFESFDSFSDEQPDDEELLDYISSWQEQ